MATCKIVIEVDGVLQNQLAEGITTKVLTWLTTNVMTNQQQT